MKPQLSDDEFERAAESLADALATWWESVSGEETYAHQWADAAEAALRLEPTDT